MFLFFFRVKGKNIKFSSKVSFVTLLKTRNLDQGMIRSNVSSYLREVRTNLVLSIMYRSN